MLPIAGGLEVGITGSVWSPLCCLCHLFCNTGRACCYHRPQKSKLETKDSTLHSGMAEMCLMMLGQHSLTVFPSFGKALLHLYWTESFLESLRRSTCEKVNVEQ